MVDEILPVAGRAVFLFVSIAKEQIMARFFIWAHRGASAVAPENTLAAFTAALEAGADGIELDVHLTRDGVPVVMHDETVDRTTNGSGRIRDLSHAEINTLDAGAWFGPDWRGEKVPTLEDVLDGFADRLKLNVEVKDIRAGLQVQNLLANYPGGDMVISSFDWPLLRKLRAANPHLPLAVLLEQPDWHRALALVENLKALALHPRIDLVSRTLLARCRQLDLPVFPWTLDDPLAARRLMSQGAAGIFTNDPGRMIAAC